MTDDHLSNETGLTVAITEAGLDLKAKSRAISAVDRFLGGLFDRFNPDIERPAQLKRARAAREDRIDEAITDKMVEAIHANSEIGERALEQHLRGIGRRYENKAAVVTLALEDLRDNPPTEKQSKEGTPEIDPDFANRFEPYAENASSDEMRARWSRVLSAEVRAPGTFSPKVLRAVDELEADTALKFEQLVKHRYGQAVPKALSGELPFADLLLLVGAGLLVDPSVTGHLVTAGTMTTAGVEQPFFGIEGDGLVITHPDSIEESKFLGRSDRGQLAIPVYLLTSTGEAVASILDYDPVAIADRLWRGLQQSIREGAINRYRLLHGRWVQIGSLKAMTPNDSFGGPNTFGGFNTPGSI